MCDSGMLRVYENNSVRQIAGFRRVDRRRTDDLTWGAENTEASGKIGEG